MRSLIALLALLAIGLPACIRGGSNRQALVDAGRPRETAPVQSALLVAIDADGRCQLAGKALSDDELKVALQQAKARGPGKTVLLQVAQGVTHGRVLEVADFARAAGLPISMGADGK
jgi:biopolymer transport protein ExbD